jgi:hypothetical protein
MDSNSTFFQSTMFQLKTAPMLAHTTNQTRPVVTSLSLSLSLCQVCGVTFPRGNYFDHEGEPHCEIHYHASRGTLCASCQKPVTGGCSRYMPLLPFGGNRVEPPLIWTPMGESVHISKVSGMENCFREKKMSLLERCPLSRGCP